MAVDPAPEQTPGIELTPLRRRTLVERVAEQLIREIETKQLPQGERLPSERALMEALGVARSTVREALNGLALLGLIEIRQGQGAFVVDGQARSRRPDEIDAALAQGITRDLLEAREAIELQIARLAAQRCTDQDVREIEAVLTKHEELMAAGKSPSRFSAQFHRELASAAHNEVLASFISSLLSRLIERGTQLESIPGYSAWELGEHRGILEAVKARDPELSVTRMREHLSEMHGYHAQLGPPTERPAS
jgi:GntR family transcriptional repressor for pyruvate dehydrogenase complex